MPYPTWSWCAAGHSPVLSAYRRRKVQRLDPAILLPYRYSVAWGRWRWSPTTSRNSRNELRIVGRSAGLGSGRTSVRRSSRSARPSTAPTCSGDQERPSPVHIVRRRLFHGGGRGLRLCIGESSPGQRARLVGPLVQTRIKESVVTASPPIATRHPNPSVLVRLVPGAAPNRSVRGRVSPRTAIAPAPSATSRSRLLRQWHPTRPGRAGDALDEPEGGIAAGEANLIEEFRPSLLSEFRARTPYSVGTRHSIVTCHRTARSPETRSQWLPPRIARRGE